MGLSPVGLSFLQAHFEIVETFASEKFSYAEFSNKNVYNKKLLQHYSVKITMLKQFF